MAGNNSNLGAAKRAKNDEFYTQLTDIEKELRHYRTHFKDKTVLCNCDDPFESNFFKYFVLNFKRLGLKKLIATCYEGSAVAEYRDGKAKPYKAVVTTVHDTTGDGGVDKQGVSCGDALLRLELHLNDAEVQPVTSHDEGHDECRLADDEPSASGSCDDQYAVGRRYGVAGTGNDDNDDNGNDNGNRHSENIS